MAETQVLEGMLIAATETPYAAFADRETGEVRPGGETLHVWVLSSFDSDPQQVRVKDRRDFEVLSSTGPTGVRLECDLRAYDSRISRVLRRRLEVGGPKPPGKG